jgi:hypothetical protein
MKKLEFISFFSLLILYIVQDVLGTEPTWNLIYISWLISFIYLVDKYKNQR